MLTFAAALLLATTVTTAPAKRSDMENPRFRSPNGELCLVVRTYPRIGDFERVDAVTYWQNEPPPPAEPKPVRGALYRAWPSGYRELLAEFDFEPYEHVRPLFVANDGHFAAAGEVGCDPQHEWLTIYAPDGSVVRKVRTLDVITRHDQRWLCRGRADEVRWSVDEEGLSPTLRATILVTEGKEDDPGARHETVDIDLATATAPQPDHDRCPTALPVVTEGGEQLLARAVVKVMPEYPEVASKARVSGPVRVEMTVGEDGSVEALRIHPLPFGIDQAVKDALAQWQFAPGERISGAFTFRFEIRRHFTMATAPPVP